MREKKPGVIERRIKQGYELFELVKQLPDERKGSVLCYLCGYCAQDKKFIEGLATALSHEAALAARQFEGGGLRDNNGRSVENE